jgi:hypothetical protein
MKTYSDSRFSRSCDDGCNDECDDVCDVWQPAEVPALAQLVL